MLSQLPSCSIRKYEDSEFLTIMLYNFLNMFYTWAATFLVQPSSSFIHILSVSSAIFISLPTSPVFIPKTDFEYIS